MKLRALTIESVTIFLFHCLFVFVPLVFTAINDELFEFNKMLVVYAIAIALLGCLIMRWVAQKKIAWKRTPLDIPLGLFLSSQIISTLLSMHPRTSLFGYYTRFNGGLFSLLSYAILYVAYVQLIPRRALKQLFLSLLFGGFLSALYAFPEHFGHSPSCFLFTGQFDVSCWVQDVQSRVFGTFGQPNWLAAYFILLTPLALLFVMKPSLKKSVIDTSRPPLTSILISIGLLGLFTSVVLFTRSRSGLAGLAVAFACLFVGSVIVALRQKSVFASLRFKYPLWILGGVISIVVLTLLIGSPLNAQLTKLFVRSAPVLEQTADAPEKPTGGTQLEVGGSESGQIRNVVWKGALAVWRRYPLFGSGVETFAYSYYKDRPQEHNLLSEWDFLYNKAHNEFLNFLATTGAVGLGTYLLLLVTIILIPLRVCMQLLSSKDKKSFEYHQWYAHVCIALSAGVIGVSLSNFLGFSTVMVNALMFVFPAMALALTNKPEEPHKTYELDANQLTVLAISACVLAIPLFFVYRLWSADVAYAKGKHLSNAGQLQQGFVYLKQAVDMMPGEPTYHDELSANVATIAVAVAQQGDATASSQFAGFALKESDITHELNPVHVNFYKTRIKVLLLLSQLDPIFIQKAQQTILQARTLSPTDPRLPYFQALLAQQQGDNAGFERYVQENIALKPNDETARGAYAKYLEEQKKYQEALDQYTYMVQFINPENVVAQERIASLSAILQKKK